jgi:hypothetical protein
MCVCRREFFNIHMITVNVYGINFMQIIALRQTVVAGLLFFFLCRRHIHELPETRISHALFVARAQA